MSRPKPLEQRSVHCKWHPHAALIFTIIAIPKFAQTEYRKERTQIRCSVAGCPFIDAIEGDADRVCKYCGAKLVNETLADPRCNRCKRERKILLDKLF